MVVQHNLTAMNANRMLGITTNSQAKSTEKLSSGYRINRAADDAAGLSISEKMRKQIRGLTKASSNAQDGISAVQTAEGALTEVTDMLQRMNELAVQAANSTNSESDRQSIQDEIKQLVEEIDRVSETTKFNETYLLKGDKNGNKSIEYSYASQVAIASKDVYKIKDDGTIETIKAGEELDPEATYYTGKEQVGKEISAADLTALQVTGGVTASGLVGAVITLGALTTAGYAAAATLVDADDYYIQNSNGDYEIVEKGSAYDSTKTYYTLSASTQGTIYSAVASTSVVTAAGFTVASGKTIYDAAGNAITSGSAINTADTYYSTVATAQFNIYASEISMINTTGLFVVNKDGKFMEVTSGTQYDSSQKYYTMSTLASGAVTYVAVETTAMASNVTTAYKAATTMYDTEGNRVEIGDVVDTAKTYFSALEEKFTGKVTDISSISKDGVESFQLLDKDGNEVAANGLYRYFDENGNYDKTINGGLYLKGGTQAVDADIVNKYVKQGESEMGKLKLSFHVGADATRKNQITIELESMSAKTLGIQNVSVAGEDDTNALNAIETIAAALSKVSSQRSGLGAIQNRLEHTIANLDNIVENTTSAESQIRDTDMATEMVNYSKNNILAQAGQSMLAQANQSNQGVLSLLG